MTEQEAYNILNEVKELDDSMYAYNRQYLESVDMALEALKKQVPKKMRVRKFDVNGKCYKFRICKSCGYTYGDVYMNYCSACGQKIDWSET